MVAHRYRWMWGTDSTYECGQPPLGCAAHSRGARQARHQSLGNNGRQVHGATQEPAVTDLAYVLGNHVKDLVSADFFVVPTATFRLLFVFVILSHDRRRPVHFAVTSHPTAEWTAQQLLQAFPWDTAPRFLLRDRDGNYGRVFRETAAWAWNRGSTLCSATHPGRMPMRSG